jgi:hypothetical protein
MNATPRNHVATSRSASPVGRQQTASFINMAGSATPVPPVAQPQQQQQLRSASPVVIRRAPSTASSQPKAAVAPQIAPWLPYGATTVPAPQHVVMVKGPHPMFGAKTMPLPRQAQQQFHQQASPRGSPSLRSPASTSPAGSTVQTGDAHRHWIPPPDAMAQQQQRLSVRPTSPPHSQSLRDGRQFHAATQPVPPVSVGARKTLLDFTRMPPNAPSLSKHQVPLLARTT